MNEPEQSSVSAFAKGESSPRVRIRHDWVLWLFAVVSIITLVIGVRQEPTTVIGGVSLKQKLLTPIEFNSAARLPLLSQVDLHALYFFNRNEGFAAGESGTLLKTTDGGQSWKRVVISRPGEYDHTGFYALGFQTVDKEIGLLGGRDGALLSSKDRGDSWTAQIAPSSGDFSPSDFSKDFSTTAQAQKRNNLSTEGGISRWWLSDINGLTFLEQSSSYYVAHSQGVGMRQIDKPAFAGPIIKADARAVAWRDGILVYASPSGMILRREKAPDALRELIRPGSFTALAIGSRWAFAAGDRFRFENLAAGNGLETVRTGTTAKLAIYNCSLAPSDMTGWAVGDSGAIWRVKRGQVAIEGKFVTDNNGTVMTDNDGTPIATEDGRAITDENGRRLLAEGGQTMTTFGGDVLTTFGGSVLTTFDSNGMSMVRRDVPGFNQTLFAVWAFDDREVIVAGKDGSIFRTRDGGITWMPLTRNCWPPDQRNLGFYLKLPALWCWLALASMGIFGWSRWRRLPATIEERDAVAEELTSDRPLMPGEVDRLGFKPFMQALSAYLRNSATQAPLTLAVTGAWGAGKSSFMNLLKADLDEKGLRTVWFNAWHHQQEPQILAPLLSAIQVGAAPPLITGKVDLAFRFRWRLFWQRAQSKKLFLLGACVLLCFGLGVGETLKWQMPFDMLANWWESLWKGERHDDLTRLIGGSTILSSLAGLILFVWRALKTFGVSPSDILATSAGKTSGHALNAQTDFRREFAEQFREVTTALKPYPLVIFIDDLDRCDVAKVFQILEAINYLVSNGDCFVVLGMSEERVRDCVALGFKDLPSNFGAAEQVKENGKDETKGSSGHAQSPEKWAQQREMAQNYLEKLVQLRIDVPRTNLESAKQVVRIEKAKAVEAKRLNIAALWARLYEKRNILKATILVLIVFLGAFFVGSLVAPRVNSHGLIKPQPTSTISTKSASNVNPDGAGMSASDTQNLASSTGVHLYEERGVAAITPEVGRVDFWGLSLCYLLGLIVVFAVWQGHRLWNRRRRVIVIDSRELKDACEEWASALHKLKGDKLTPRMLKRFKNRVRFYSMMRGREGSFSGPLSNLSDADLVALGAMEDVGCMTPGLPEAAAFNLEMIANLSIDDRLREQVMNAISRLMSDDSGRRVFQTTRAMIRRA